MARWTGASSCSRLTPSLIMRTLIKWHLSKDKLRSTLVILKDICSIRTLRFPPWGITATLANKTYKCTESCPRIQGWISEIFGKQHLPVLSEISPLRSSVGGLHAFRYDDWGQWVANDPNMMNGMNPQPGQQHPNPHHYQR